MMNETLPTLDNLPFIVSQDALNGQKGTNRCYEKKALIPADNDFQAIQCWLNEYRHKKTTYQSYRKEAERLLLWCLFNAKKPLSSLDREDFEQYFSFLDNPQPAHIWCKKKGGYGIKRGEKGWKPFQGGLSPSAKITAISILKSLMHYLYESRYLDSNPLVLMRGLKQFKTSSDERKWKVYARILEDDEFDKLIETLEELPEETTLQCTEKLRLKLLIGLLYFLGLRVEDVTTSQWNAFKKMKDNWWFIVKGKGDKFAKIPVNNALLKIILDYRVHMNMRVYPESDEFLPLIGALKNPEMPISDRQVNILIKQLAEKTAAKFHDHPEKQEKILKLSPHWFRHQSASMQARLGIPAEHIRENMRHSNYQTTLIYIHANDDDRIHSVNLLHWKTRGSV
jgi:integrase